MKEKLWKSLVFAFIILWCASSALAVSDSCVVPLDTENTHALLVKGSENNYIVGGTNKEAILQALETQSISSISAVIVPCAHEEHISAIQALCDHFQTNAILHTEPLETEHTPLRWLESCIAFSEGANSFAFGVSQPIDGNICYQCDGSLLAFSATTNEASVNVRDCASTSGKRVSKLTRGTVLTVKDSLLNEKNELWYQVVLKDGTEGYIRSDLLQYISEDEVSAQAADQNASVKKENRYIGNKNSKVFHRPSCGSLPSGKNQVYFDSRSYAVSKGYKPCSHCDP